MAINANMRLRAARRTSPREKPPFPGVAQVDFSVRKRMSLGKKENKVNANSGDQEKNLWKNGGKPEEKDGRTAALSPSSTIVGPGSKKSRFHETGSVDV